MYLKIVIDSNGNTQVRQPSGDLNIKCPYCSCKNKYLFNSDSNLFCNNCGKILITGVENIETYTEEEVEEFIQVLKLGASVYERRDAALCLGTLPDHPDKNIIISLLERVNRSDPDSEVRDNAKESIEKLRNIKKEEKLEEIADIQVIEIKKEEKPEEKQKIELVEYSLEDDLLSLLGDEESEITIKKDQTAQKNEVYISPYKTLKLPKPVFKKEPSKAEEKKKKSTLNMTDDLLSLLDD